MKFIKFISIIFPFLLVFVYQNCSQTHTGNPWYVSQCTGYLCEDTGVGEVRNLNIALAASSNDMLIPYSGTPPYTLKISGSCNDGGFRRNRIKVQLIENFISENDCQNGEIFTVNTKCEAGQYIGDIEIDNNTSLCAPSRNQVLQLQIDLTGIDSFDNEYNPPRGSIVQSIPVRQSIRPPIFNSFADGGSENMWNGTRVFSSLFSYVQISDFFGYCTYSSGSVLNNDIGVLIKPVGVSDSAGRLAFTDPNDATHQKPLPVVCGPLNPADGAIYQKGTELGYNGLFRYVNPIQLNYLQDQAWPGLLGADATVNSRDFTMYLVQRDPTISSTFKIESPQQVTFKFNGVDTSQGWTADVLKQAQKQTLRAINMSWDDSSVTNNDFSKILGTGASFPFRLWIYERMQLVEDFSTFKVVSPNGPSTPFFDRIGKIAFGTKRCDTRLDSDMVMGISGTDGVNSYSASNRQAQRLALCSWYWVHHGLLDGNPTDVGNWKNNWVSKWIQEGVRFTGDNRSCVSASTSTTGDATACSMISNYFRQINLYKGRFLGSANDIYGGSGSVYRDWQLDFNSAYTQFYVNQIMGYVVSNLVNSTQIATNANVFFDSVIKNVYDTASNPKRLYGTAAANLEKRKQLYPIEINLASETNFTPTPFQTYKTKVAPGSTDSKGSEDFVPFPAR